MVGCVVTGVVSDTATAREWLVIAFAVICTSAGRGGGVRGVTFMLQPFLAFAVLAVSVTVPALTRTAFHCHFFVGSF